MKKTLFILMALMLLAVSAAAGESAGDEFEIVGDVLVRYYGPGGEVTVPDGVAVLGEDAFSNSLVTKVNLPETLKEIRSYCFFECRELTEITLPASLVNLENDGNADAEYSVAYAQVFANNPKLTAIHVESGNTHYTSVDGVLFSADQTRLLYYPDGKNPGGEYAIPEGTVSTGYTAFGSPTFTSVTLPASLVSLYDGGGSFSMIPSLKEINADPGNPEYYSVDGVLYTREGALVCYPNGRTAESLRPEDFPEEMDSIGLFAFQGDMNLKTIELPDGVLSMDWMCFSEMRKLESILIPESVEYIPGFAFTHDKKLKKVTILSRNAKIEENNILEDSNRAVICAYEGSTAQEYAGKLGLAFETLPEGPSEGNPIRIRVLILPKFEIGEMEGDFPGEAQLYYEHYMTGAETYEIPGSSEESLLYVKDGIALYLTGIGKVNGALSTMAVLSDKRFDFSDAYILSTGCAGSAAEYGVMGDVYVISAAADYDLGHHADSREMTGDTEVTWFHDPELDSAAVIMLNPELTEKAYALVKDLPMKTTEKTRRSMSSAFDNAEWAVRDPKVLRGTAVTGDNYWKGRYDHQNAVRIVQTYGCPDPYAATEMEDIGVCLAAKRMGMLDRLIILRAGVNMDVFMAGATPESLWGPGNDETLASEDNEEAEDIFATAMENNFIAGGAIIDAILNGDF